MAREFAENLFFCHELCLNFVEEGMRLVKFDNNELKRITLMPLTSKA